MKKGRLLRQRRKETTSCIILSLRRLCDRLFMRLYPGNPYARLAGLTRNLRFQRLILVQQKAEKTVSSP